MLNYGATLRYFGPFVCSSVASGIDNYKLDFQYDKR